MPATLCTPQTKSPVPMVAVRRPSRSEKEKIVHSAEGAIVPMKEISTTRGAAFAMLGAENSEPGNSHIQQDSMQSVSGGAPQWLTICFWVCTVIAVAAAARRFITLLRPSGSSMMSGLDATFASHTTLILAHIIPATAFVLLAPFALFRASEKRWIERTLMVLGVIVGITAYAMSVDAFGGWTERTAVLFFNSLFLFSLGRAFLYSQAGALIPMRRWLTRAIGILLGIATTRPVMGVFFATSRLTHLEQKQFFGIAFWIGFSINTIVVEMWLRAGNHLPMKMELDRISKMR
jgi:hypothetical protein